MTILNQFLFDLINRQPGLFGREIRARFGGKIPAKKINLALRSLKMNGHIRVRFATVGRSWAKYQRRQNPKYPCRAAR
jgi:hypothetical protein